MWLFLCILTYRKWGFYNELYEKNRVSFTRNRQAL